MSDSRVLTRSREFLENLIDAVREPLVVLDENLRVLSVSRAFYEVFRAKPQETVGQLIYDLGNRQWDIPQLRELLEDILPKKTTFKDYEVVHSFSTIGRRTMLLNARQIKSALGQKRIILLAIEDITVRKATELHLEQARQDLAVLKISEDSAREFAESIIDTIREPLIALDQDLRIIAVSRAFYGVFRTKPEETVGQLIYDLGNRQWDIPKLRELLEAILLQSTTFNDYEVVHDFATIGKRIMLLNARQVKRSLGMARIILLAIEDITDKKAMEAELQKAQRVESLGVLAGGIAHDFNNLMAGLMVNTELAEAYLRAGKTEAALDRMGKTPAIFARGRALTRRLLTFSKGGAPIRFPTALGPLFAEWAEFALMGSEVTAAMNIDPQLWACNCDVGQIGQVMNNLLINARQASREGGVVSIQASNLMKLTPYVKVTITNGGPPIPPEIIGRIFDPFFTTKAEGSGLGLAISFSIVRQHGGWMDVASEDGKGTSLTVVLPALPTPATQDKAVPSLGAYRRIDIAVVMDDDADLRDAVGAMMAGFGFDVLRAENGTEVLAISDQLRRTGSEIGVFLLDGQVPGDMGGLETAHRLRQGGVKSPIVIMSGHFDTGPDSARAGDDGLWRLAKPFSTEELSQVLRASC